MSKNTLRWYDGDNPQRTAVAVYRKPETEQKEIILQNFFEFAKDQFELNESDAGDLQAMIQEFLGYDEKKVEEGEKELLQQWINSVKGE